MLGICGGYQMLAGQIEDEVESRRGTVDGLGLLPVRIRFGAEKILGRPRGSALGAAVAGLRSITASPRSPTRPVKGPNPSSMAAAAAQSRAQAGTAPWRTTRSGGPS